MRALVAGRSSARRSTDRARADDGCAPRRPPRARSRPRIRSPTSSSCRSSSIPLQFGDSLDFTGYPRPIDADLAACAAAGVDAVYAPTAAAMYPTGFETRVRSRRGSPRRWRARAGPATSKAWPPWSPSSSPPSRPDVAVFGEKDFQQLAIIRRMVTDLDFGVDVVGCPTVREPDGLALSSRNQRLDAAAAHARPLRFRGRSSRRFKRRVVPRTSVDDMIAERDIGHRCRTAGVTRLRRASSTPTRSIGVRTIIDSDRVAGRYRIAIAARFGDVR